MKTLFTEEERETLTEATLSERNDPHKELAAINALLDELPMLKRHWTAFHDGLTKKLDALDSAQTGVGAIASRGSSTDESTRALWRHLKDSKYVLSDLQRLEDHLLAQKSEVEQETGGKKS